MTNKLEDRWVSRDLPVLRETARLLDGGTARVQVKDLVEPTGLDQESIVLALNALVPGYLDGKPMDSWGGRLDWFVNEITERGRRAVGLWPRGESVDALVDALRQAEDATDDPEEKSALRRAAGAVLGVGRDVMTDIMAAVIAKQMGV